MVRGWGRWYPVEDVTIEIKFAWPGKRTGCLKKRNTFPVWITRDARVLRGLFLCFLIL